MPIASVLVTDDITTLRAALAAEQLARREAEARASGADKHAGVGRVLLEVRDQTPTQHVQAPLARLGVVTHHGRRLAGRQVPVGLEVGHSVVGAEHLGKVGRRVWDRAKRPHMASG